MNKLIKKMLTPPLFYYPNLKAITGSTNSAILLQAIIDHMDKGQPFWKFKEPCGHELYRVGHSWSEFLGFTADEFDGALKKIAVKTTRKKALEAMEQDESLVVYWTDMNHLTWYWVNLSLLARREEEI